MTNELNCRIGAQYQNTDAERLAHRMYIDISREFAELIDLVEALLFSEEDDSNLFVPNVQVPE